MYRTEIPLDFLLLPRKLFSRETNFNFSEFKNLHKVFLFLDTYSILRSHCSALRKIVIILSYFINWRLLHF